MLTLRNEVLNLLEVPKKLEVRGRYLRCGRGFKSLFVHYVVSRLIFLVHLFSPAENEIAIYIVNLMRVCTLHSVQRL